MDRRPRHWVSDGEESGSVVNMGLVGLDVLVPGALCIYVRVILVVLKCFGLCCR